MHLHAELLHALVGGQTWAEEVVVGQKEPVTFNETFQNPVGKREMKPKAVVSIVFSFLLTHGHFGLADLSRGQQGASLILLDQN